MVKKLFSLICAFILTGTSGFAADVSRLYTVKNAKAAEVEKVLTPYLKRNFPSALKGQNSYILEDKNKKYYYVVILADKNENCYFYYMSNNEDESLRKELIETLKNNDFKSKKVRNSSLKSYFYGEAYTNLAHSNVNIKMRTTAENSQMLPPQNEIINASAIEYDFSDEAQTRFNGSNSAQNIVVEPKTEPPIELQTQEKAIVKLPKIESSWQGEAFNPNSGTVQSSYNSQGYQSQGSVLTGSVIYIQDGATFTAALLSDISSDSIVNNDRVSAELDADWIYNGQLIAPAGSILNGRAVDTKAASYAMANGQIGLLFNEIMTPDGNIIPLKTNKVYIVGNSSRALNVTKRIAGGAATGLLLSAISMLFGADPTSAIIYGTSIGVGAGAISTISSKGEEIRVIEGSQLQIMLTEPLTVQLYRQQ
ncbi:hypothetical protein KID03_01755 [bacterium]|nr:hypothetical protein [bacterium]